MNHRLILGLLACTVVALWGCRGMSTPATGQWRSEPGYVEVDNPDVRVRFEPLKNGRPYFFAFRLTLTNKSAGEVRIDWNASRYLFNGRDQGVFVFEGIDPEAVGNAAVPPDAVAPGAQFQRDIMPLRLIAWNPIKNTTADRRSISPGIMPAAENGMRLVLEHENGPITIPMAVRLSNDRK